LSRRPIARSPDLSRLLADGYHVAVRHAHLVVSNIPYVDANREVHRGTLVMPLTLANDVTVNPVDHTTHFIGAHPCNQNGVKLTAIVNGSGTFELAPGLVAQHYFSAKPPKEKYDDYYEKVATYGAILSGPASVLEPGAVPNPGGFVPSSDDADSVFHYLDTASPRAEITAITAKLERRKVVIVGLGGTGGYVLDQVAKTPVEEIHLYDGDVFHQHNAFRAPGAASGDELDAQPFKVHYFAGIYSKMRRGIEAHAEYLDASNIDALRDADFVFVCIDDGDAKALIVERLEQFGLPFIDVGMGIYAQDGKLGGVVRVTTSTPTKREHIRERGLISFANTQGEDDYNRNIQVADLNALNAIMAVLRWKKLWGFYVDFERERHSTYTVDTNELTNEDSE
jgi:hypothetical protein